MDKIIYHIDVNSAFLSWEASYRVNILGESLDIRTVPSVIGGSEESRHGIVLAKSGPAKKYNIQTGEPLVQARQKCPNLLVVPPNYPMYVDASKSLMRLLREYSDDIHQYSIDESFVDMSSTCHLFGSPVTAAELIKDRIRDELGFTVNIGVSCNKLLAKMASDFKKPDMVHTLFPDEVPAKMWPLPVRDLFFVGRATERRLASYGINTIGELAGADVDWLQRTFKSHGHLIWEFANGIADQMDKVTLSAINKGYGNSMTVPFDVKDRDSAKLVLLSLTETVGSRIRADGAFVSVVAVSIVDCEFNHSSRQMNLTSPTDITRQIYEAACSLFDKLWDGSPIRQLGVHTSKATSSTMYQYSLFDDCDIERESRLDRAIDSIRATWGEDAIMRGCFIKLDKDGVLGHMSGGLDKSRRTGITKELPDTPWDSAESAANHSDD